MAGRPVVIVPGNHDHALAEPWLARLRLAGERVPAEAEWPVEPGDGAAGRISEWMPDVQLTLAYPGLRLRDDVYATHGHYLDLHLTIPRLESIAASAMGRITKLGHDAHSAADYETILAPLYAFYAGLAQGASAAALAGGSSFSRRVWQWASDGRGAENPDPALVATRERASAVATRFLLGRVTIPGAVAALTCSASAPSAQRSPARSSAAPGSMRWRAWPRRSRPGRRHVVFGHTHRPGPLARDDLPEWTTASGTRLWNSGSWLHEGAFVRSAKDSPYWPGTVLTVEDDGPPAVRNVLAG